MFGLSALAMAADAVWTEPWSDPLAEALARGARDEARPVLLGDGEIAPWELVERLGEDEPDARLEVGLATELRRGAWQPSWTVRPHASIAVGDAVPDNAGGATEPGWLTTRARVDGALYSGPFVLLASPEGEVGFAGTDAGEVRMQTLWGGAALHGWAVGFGRQARWYGPGRHGALLWSANARPPWMGGISGEGRLPGVLGGAGVFRIETSVGWLDQPRGDVARPGLLLVDLRWMPIPLLELGATRMSIFGGEGRPRPDVGQLLLPTEPHVEDDPDHLLADQDELAALDLRLNLPLERWSGVPIQHVELWWQYGGEDVIGRQLGPVPYPSLAGVGNLYGGEIEVAPITVTVEYTRLMDDYFRWYVGHRVYHDGFTQAGRPLGHFGGPDSETFWAAVAWEGGRGRARIWADRVWRVGVIEALEDHVFTLTQDERGTRVGLDAGWSFTGATQATLSASWEGVDGEDFVPGATGAHFRACVGVEHVFAGAAGRR